MIKLLFITMLTLTSFCFADANKEREQDAKKSINDKIAMYTQEIKDRCGNKTINIQLDWTGFDKLDFSKHKGLEGQDPKAKRSLFMDGAGFQGDFEKVLSSIFNTCVNDKNKAALSKIENVFVYVQQETPAPHQCFQYDKAKKTLFAKIGMQDHCKGAAFIDRIVEAMKSEGAVTINM